MITSGDKCYEGNKHNAWQRVSESGTMSTHLAWMIREGLSEIRSRGAKKPDVHKLEKKKSFRQKEL